MMKTRRSPIRVVAACAAMWMLALLTGAPSASAPVVQQASFDCSYQALTQSLLDESRLEDWVSWIAALSGAKPVNIGGQTFTISTRSSYAMFGNQENALAYAYILQTLQQWYPDTQIEEDTFYFQSHVWKNLVLNLPGSRYPEQVVILSAHLDSTSPSALSLAPGADDNAAGAAALLEAARLLRSRVFERTIRIIWFTGEEQGMIGSQDYVRTHALDGVVGVINLDMFSYDADGDRCIELQVGALAQSDAVGRCFMQSIDAYHLGLTSDYFYDQPLTTSDHSSFWSAGIGAIQVGENFRSLSTPGGCQSALGADLNPNYHKITDTLENINTLYGFSVTQAALASIYSMASPAPEAVIYRLYLPALLN